VLRIERLTDPGKVDIAPDFFAITRSGELREMLARILELDSFVVAAVRDSVMLGYAVDLPYVAIEFEGMIIKRRWHDLPDVRELGAIEVARGSREKGLAKKLLEALAENERLENKIVIGEGLMWHWDYEARGVSVSQCRAQLLSLFASANYRNYRTNEPEVSFSPLNFLMARVGSKVTAASRKAFESALMV
jgi:GNAT superfamily N-acetyltransferase